MSEAKCLGSLHPPVASASQHRWGEEAAVIEAIRDQWAIGVAVIVLMSLVAWLWAGRTKTPRS